MSIQHVSTGRADSILPVAGSNITRTHPPTSNQIRSLRRVWLGDAPVVKGVVVSDVDSPIADEDFEGWADETLAWSGLMFAAGRESWPHQ